MITLTRPEIAPGTLDAIARVIESGRLTPGPEVDKFEKEWAAYCRMKYGVACNSGTTALEMAIKALDLTEKDRVLVPAFACIPVVTPLLNMRRARLSLVDCDRTGNITESTLMQALGVHPDATAVIVVHTYGNKIDDAVFRLARRRCLKIIEDCAEAHGIKPQGDMACFSFRGDKMITTGGAGGMCLTNNEAAARYMKSYTLLGLTGPQSSRYDAEMVGNGIQMGEVQAAFGRQQIQIVWSIIEARKKVAALYDELLAKSGNVQMAGRPDESVYWRYMVTVGAGVDRTAIIDGMLKRDVELMASFRSLEYVIRRLTGMAQDHCWHAAILGETGVCLPIHSLMSESDVKFVVDRLEEVCSTGG